MSKEHFTILVPTGMLGYGFPVEWFEKGLARNPDIISIDAGSTDSGPQKLALGEMTCTEEAYHKEMDIVIEAGLRKKIPVFITSCGGDGTNLHVDLFVELAKRIAAKQGKKLRIAVIRSDIDKTLIKKRMAEARVEPCGYVPELTEKDVDDATVIVAQMGIEPFIDAFDRHGPFDLVLTGRSYDPAPMAAMAIRAGFDPGLSWHVAKIAECGALCAEPAGRVLLATVYRDHFVVEAMNPAEKCKTYSVAAHTLYEKSHPYLLKGPGGTLDLSQCVFEQIDDGRTKVSGSRFIPSEKYTVKLEGACVVGYRSVCVAGIRDPIMIGQIDPVLDSVRELTQSTLPDEYGQSELIFHVYGKNGVMGELEFDVEHVPLELCVIIEVASPTQAMAKALCNKARTTLLHCPYEGRIATAANIGLPFTPLEIPLGKVCRFNVYHLMELDNPCEVFPLEIVEA